MKELSSRAQALVDAARAADAPKKSDRARIQARLTAALGASAFTAAASQAAAMGAATAATSGAASAASGATSAAFSGASSATGASGAAAASGASAAAGTSGVAAASGTVLSGAGSMAAGATTTSLASGGAAAAGATLASGGAAASGAGAAGAGVAGSSWVAALGAKGVAWIGAAALSTAVGTTAVVTTNSHSATQTPERPAAASVEQPVPARADASPLSKVHVQPAPGPEKSLEASQENATETAVLPARAASKPQDVVASAPMPKLAARSGIQTPARKAARVQSPSSDTAAAVPVLSETEVARPSFAALAAPRLTPASEHKVEVASPDDEDDEVLPTELDPSTPLSVAPRIERTEAEVGPARVAAPPVAAAAAPDPSAAAARVQPSAAATPMQPSAAAAKLRGGAPQPGAALAGELELLARAQRALHDGKLSLALTLLDQHSAQHAQGALREERLAARAVVLCRMHQPGAGQAEAQRLAAQTPRSPLLPWVRENCKQR